MVAEPDSAVVAFGHHSFNVLSMSISTVMSGFSGNRRRNPKSAHRRKLINPITFSTDDNEDGKYYAHLRLRT